MKRSISSLQVKFRYTCMKYSPSHIHQMTQCALFTGLIAISAFIQIPLPYFDYVTLQFLIVLLAGFLLGARWGSFSVLLYVFIGLLGIPVFAAGGGPGYILQPSFGYLIGFVLSAYVCGYIIDIFPNKNRNTFIIASCLGLLITYGIGLVYKYMILNLYIGQSVPWSLIILSCFPIDLPCDLVLALCASGIGYRFRPYIYRTERKTAYVK